jgi:hypothetical protein
LKSSLSLLHMMEKVSPGLNQVPIQRGAHRPIYCTKTRLTQAVLSTPPTFLSSPELLLGSRLTHSTKAHLGASPWTPLSRLSTYKPMERRRQALLPATTQLQEDQLRPRRTTLTRRAEVLRLWTTDFRDDKDLTPDDRTYVAQLVAARTGLGQADAEKRVNQVIAEAKATAERTRRGAAHLSFWLTAALLFGAFAASLAAVEGGALRDGTWNDRVLTPRAL